MNARLFPALCLQFECRSWVMSAYQGMSASAAAFTESSHCCSLHHAGERPSEAEAPDTEGPVRNTAPAVLPEARQPSASDIIADDLGRTASRPAPEEMPPPRGRGHATEGRGARAGSEEALWWPGACKPIGGRAAARLRPS